MDKQSVFEKLVDFHKLKKKQVAYIGDDINDLGILRTCGLSACPADTFDYIKKEVDIVTETRGDKEW